MATFSNTWDETLPLDNSLSGISEAGKIDVLIRQLKLDIRERILKFIPVGMVVKWSSPVVPYGFMECKGSSLLRTKYPDLFTVIGITHGAIDSSHFSIPKISGYFVRGWNNGKSSGLYDPDTSLRTDRGDGTTGDHVGTKQEDENKVHTHGYNYSWSGGSLPSSASAPNSSTQTGLTGDSENRPANIYFKYIIRIDDELSDGSYNYTRTWDETIPISTNYMGRMALELRKLRSDVKELIDNFFPPGGIIYWPNSTCPDGYLELNGQAVDRAVYADLFNEIDDIYGPGDGISTFNVPDARGLFIRAQDNSAGVDSMAATRTGGDNVGSTQTNGIKSHQHSITQSNGSSWILNGVAPYSNHTGTLYDPNSLYYADGSVGTVPLRTVDSHPKNMYLMAIMKAKKVA